MKLRIITGPFYFTRQATGTMPQIKAKLPEMFRKLEYSRAEINDEERTIPVVFASEQPVGRWFGRERLICTPEACDVSRVNNLGAVLFEHDRTSQIGVVVKDSFAFGADRKARATLRFSKNNPLAEREWMEIKDGVRGLFSVGYVVHRLVLREENDELGDLYDAMEWEPLEISLVGVPADVNCTIDGRSEKNDNFPVLITADTHETQTALTTMTRNARNYFARQMAPDTGANPPAPAAPKEGERAQQPKPEKVIDIEDRNRCRELAAIGVRFGCVDEMEKMIEDGSSVAKALRYVTDNELRAIKPGQNGNPAPGQTPLLTGGGSQQKPLARTIGDFLIESQALKDYREGTGGKRSAAFDIPGFDIRATLASTAIPSGSISTTELPMVPALETRLTIADLMRNGSVSTGQVHYMIETAPTNAATTVAEGGLKPEATFAFTDATSPVRKIAVLIRVNDEALEDYPFLRSYVDGKGVYMIREREEAQILNGDGNAPNLTGILNTAGIQTQAKGADSNVDAIHKAITKIRVTGQAEPSGIVMHPNDAQIIFLAKDANGQYLAGGPFYAPYGNGAYSNARSVWGMPLVETTAITQGTALVGAFRQYSAIYRRSGITVETTNSDGDDFKYNRTAIRIEERLASVVERPAAFCTVTGIAE